MQHRLHAGLIILMLALPAGIAGCHTAAPTTVARTQGLTQALTALEGTYAWHADPGRYVYSAKLALQTILSAQPSAGLVDALIACMGDMTPTASTLKGKPVPLGMVCYQGLTQLVYHEATAANGDVARSWPGYMSPDASPARMRQAQKAWEQAKEAGALIDL